MVDVPPAGLLSDGFAASRFRRGLIADRDAAHVYGEIVDER